VSFVIALVSLAATETIVDLAQARRGGGIRVGRLVLPTAALAATLAYGAYAQRAYASPGEDGRRILVVQGNVPNEFRWKRAFFERTLATYARLSYAPHGERPDLIVWPENAVNFYVNREPMLLQQIGTVAGRARDGLLLGGPRLADDTHARNSAYLLDAGGGARATYDKRRLVPFAEYDPFLGAKTGGPEQPFYSPGGDAQPLRAADMSLGTIICYEVLFPHLVRDLVAKGADVLVNLANDAWLDGGDDSARQQHFSMTVFRAIETRRFLVRAAANGVSGLVTPLGRPYALIASDTAGASEARVQPRQGLTPYVRWGHAWVVVVGGVVLALARRRPGSVT
jgi:apolipoprotein N-acyltransferase